MNRPPALLPSSHRRAWLAAAAVAAVSAASLLSARARAGASVAVPPPRADLPSVPGARQEIAVVAGGCFWGVQGVFQHVAGVVGAVSGYAGGSAESASYRRVGSGSTGHAEAVRVVYDPSRITFGQLLQIFFAVAHDPTELNRQGPDRGTQYRSAIFPANPAQAEVARAYIAQLDGALTFGKPLATTIEPLKDFYPAEAYHQDYLTRHPTEPYIVINDLPKVEQLRRTFPAVYREQPVLVGAG